MRLLKLMLILLYMWGLILLASFIIFKAIATIPEIFPPVMEPYATAVLKAILGVLLVLFWIALSRLLIERYARSKHL